MWVAEGLWGGGAAGNVRGREERVRNWDVGVRRWVPVLVLLLAFWARVFLF